MKRFSDHFRFGRYSLCGPAVFRGVLLLVVCVTFAAEKTGLKKNAALILQSANSNENSYSNGEFVSILRGNVVFLYDDITIRSDEATWWRNEGRVNFRNNIRISQESQLLTCDRMQFTKQTNRIDASGHFLYRDTAQLTELSGDKAGYRLDTKFFTLTGDPRLIRYDTTSAETLTIVGRKVTYADSVKEATVIDSVVITKGTLVSHCGKAVYNTESSLAQLRRNPRVTYDIHEIVGDSIDLQFGEESLKGASIYGGAHGVYIDTAQKGRDTAFTHVWGDSLYMSISDSGYLDSLYVVGKAVSKYFAASSSDMVNQANGKVMVMSFGKDGDVNRVKLWGNARSTYFIEENDSRGVNEASGDSITVEFSNGKAAFLNLAGSARGVFFPRDL
jgi:lipopolysaccharide export system protein LptA